MPKRLTKHKPHSQWSIEDKTRAAMLYVQEGTNTAVERLTGIPHNTISQWHGHDDVWERLLEEFRNQQTERNIAQYNKITELAQQKTLELIPTIKDAQKAITVAAISQDKGRVLQSLPNQITAGSDDMRAKAAMFEKLSKEWHKRNSVVSTQHPDKDDE